MQIQEARVFVEGEDEICVGDVATLQVRLLRSNLREGEAAGAGHAPLLVLFRLFAWLPFNSLVRPRISTRPFLKKGKSENQEFQRENSLQKPRAPLLVVIRL
ncbi:unnamed protein product [Polarella glacialis]|uniref:Uncharacterized protein n=1 Tax=Polarella glacialis TaxID=89957 RepID=A0A813IWF4_POLGL|nr:unnamed protein product [Polarella glacialis]CAE8658090.1 unnamed protein product [Polarella glacialis]